MSRLARKPLEIPKGVDITRQGNILTIKGPKGQFDFTIHDAVEVEMVDGNITVKPTKHVQAKAMLGTVVSLLRNKIKGVSEGFEKALKLIGVGYRAKATGNKIELTLGFSHPVVFDIPEGITVDIPSNTDIILKGADKELIGQTAANIRMIRPPEPYKGKGVRYADEHITIKETKKK